MIHLLFLLLGLVVGLLINLLADVLPRRWRGKEYRWWPPTCPRCGHDYGPAGWWAIGRLFLHNGRCPNCALPTRPRVLMVEGGTAVLFAALPFFFTNPANLVINSLYIAILILVIVIDLEHRLILNVVTYPGTALALLGSVFLTDTQNTIGQAVVGAIVGFVLFYVAYWVGQLTFGPGALGYGDVKLSLMLGAMLGFHRIFFALMLGILLGGAVSLVLLASRRFSRDQYLPYGQYLALAGIIMLIWGVAFVDWYIN